MMDPIILLQIAWTGIAISSYYVLFTIAFALALKVMQLWNFAQAGLMALAFYAMFFALNRLGLPLPLGIVFGIAVTVAAAVALEVFGLRTLRERRSGNLTFFIFTLIVAEFIAYLLMMLFGTEPQTLFPSILSQVHIVMNIAISNWDLIAVATTLICVIALWAFLRFHQDGQFMLAVAENAGLAELYGISAKRAYLVTMILVALISCAGMYLFGSRSGVFPTTPLELLLVAVIATLLGGMGRIFAAGIAAVVIGLIQSMSVLFISSQWQTLVLYVFLFVTIIFFPLGFRLPLWLRKVVKPAA